MADRGFSLGLVGPLPPPNGGMAMQTVQLANMMRSQGVEVDLLQSNAPYRPAFVGQLRGIRALFRLLPYLLQVWGLAGRVSVIHLMANSGWSWQLFAAPVVWIAWLRGTPVVVNYRGGEARQYLQRSHRWVAPTLSKATQIIVPSAFLREVFKEFGFDAKIIPNIVDLETFKPQLKAQLNAQFTVVATRNLERIYGLDTAIRAIALVIQKKPEVQLKIAGSGPLLAELQALTDELDVADKVSFLGRLDRDGIVALYEEADAALNPSRVDNMPNSVLEALACGLPVVSTDVGGVPYIVEDGRTALLVKPDQPAAMAAALLKLMDDSDTYARLREEGISEVAKYSRPAVQPRWTTLYRQLVSSS